MNVTQHRYPPSCFRQETAKGPFRSGSKTATRAGFTIWHSIGAPRSGVFLIFTYTWSENALGSSANKTFLFLILLAGYKSGPDCHLSTTHGGGLALPLLIAERHAEKSWIPIFIVFGLTRRKIELESTSSVANALTTRQLIGFIL